MEVTSVHLHTCACARLSAGFVPRGSPALSGREQGREGLWAVDGGTWGCPQGQEPPLLTWGM